VHDSRRRDHEIGQPPRHWEINVAEVVSIPDRRSLTRLLPVLRLVAAIRQAFDLRKLMIAALGLALLQPGWVLLDRLVPTGADTTPDLFASSDNANSLSEAGFWSPGTLAGLHARLSEPFRLLATPLLVVVDPGSGRARMLHALLGVIWLVIVWGISGGAICRIAIVQVAALRQMTVIDALRFAMANAGPLIGAPLCPLIGIAFCGAIGAAFGLVYRLPAIGPALAGIGLVVPLAAGLVMTLLLAGLMAGWPLLHAATAGGAEDALDALSRIFGYLNQRLGSFVVLVALAWLGGMMGLALVDVFTVGVIRLTHWSVGLTAPAGLTEALFNAPSKSSAGIAGATHVFWLGLVRLIAHGWIYSFYWTTAANLYLWLRHDIDGSPWTEIDRPVSDAGTART
jgi:hypothetical protein